MKGYMKLLFAIVFAIFLSGCATGEVQQRVVIHAIGIDKHDKGFEVSYQVFSGGEGSDSGPVDANEDTVKTLLSQGKTLTACEESLELQTGKDVFFGDTELILVSEELKDRDITEFLQYFRNADVYLGVNVCYCRGKAKDTVGAKLDQGAATAILLRGVVERALSEGRACSSRIIEISNALADGESIAIPILSLEQGGNTSGTSGTSGESDKSGAGDAGDTGGAEDSGKDSTISDTTIGVFDSILISREGTLGEADETTAQGVRILKGNVKNMELETEAGGRSISVEVDNVKIKRRLEITDNRPLLKIEIAGEYDIRFAPPGLPEEEVIAAAETKILELCKVAAEKMSETGADLVNLQKMLEKYYPEYAEKVTSGQAIRLCVYDIGAKLKKY